MTPHFDDSSGVWYVTSGGPVRNSGVSASGDYGVRPVINLLKSSI